MTDILEFDVALDTTLARKQAAALEKQLDRTIKLKVEFDSKTVLAELEQLNAKTKNIGITVNVDFDPAQVEASLRSVFRAVEESGVEVDGDVAFDAAQIVDALDDAVTRAEKGARKIDLGVEFNEAAIAADFQRLATELEQLAGDFDIGFDVDATELLAEAKRAIEVTERLIPKLKIGVELEPPSAAEIARLRAELEVALGKIEVNVDVDRGGLPGGGRGGRGSGGGNGSPGLSDANREIQEFLTNAGKLTGVGQQFGALAGKGGPVAGLALALVAVNVAAAATPALIFAAAGAVGVFSGVFAGIGIGFAAELEPLLNAIEGLEDFDGVPLKRELENIAGSLKGILGGAFLPLGRQIAKDFAGPLQEGLANFTAGALPGITAAVNSLLPAIQNLANVFAGPLGESVGRLTAQFGELLANVLPKLTDARFTDFLDRFTVLLSESQPGIEAFIDTFFELGDNILGILEQLNELAPAVLAFFSLLGDAIEVSVGGLALLSRGLFDLRDKVLGPLDELAGGSKGLDELNDSANTVRVTMKSTGNATDDFAKRLVSIGDVVGGSSINFDKLATEITNVTKKGFGKATPAVETYVNSINSLRASAERGEITNEQFSQSLFQVAAQLGLNNGQVDEAVERYKALVKANEDAEKALEQASEAAGKLNEQIGLQPKFFQLSAEAQTLVRLAMLDGVITGQELIATQQRLGISAKETEGIYKILADEIGVYKEALLGVIPTAQTAADAIDLTKVKLGQKTGALLNELRLQVSDTLNFFGNLQKIIDAGNIDLARFIVGSGLTKQVQEALAAEGALGGPEIVSKLNTQVQALKVGEGALQQLSQSLSTQLGTSVSAGLQGGVDASKANADAKAAELAATISTQFGPDLANNINKGIVDAVANINTEPIAAVLGLINDALISVGEIVSAPTVEINDQATQQITEIGKALKFLDDSVAIPDVFLNDEATAAINDIDFRLKLLDARSATVDIIANAPIIDAINTINAALDLLDNRTVTVDIVQNVITQPRKDGGPVFPGFTYRFNEAGREAIADDRGIRLLPPGERTGTFDRPGYIIPADQINGRVDALRNGTTTTTTTTTTSRVTNNSPTINVTGAGRDPMIVARRVARLLP